MNCPSCGAPMALADGDDHLTCAYCGNLHFPEPNPDGVRMLGEHSELECPVCRVALVKAALGGVRLLYCEHCRGLLIEVDVFLALLDGLRASGGTIPRPASAGELMRRLDCPKCHDRMDTHPYGGPGNIVIDNCPACELNWLDCGEIQRIGRAAAAESRIVEV